MHFILITFILPLGFAAPIPQGTAQADTNGIPPALSGTLGGVEDTLNNVVGGNAGGAVGTLLTGESASNSSSAAASPTAAGQAQNNDGVTGALGEALQGVTG